MDLDRPDGVTAPGEARHRRVRDRQAAPGELVGDRTQPHLQGAAGREVAECLGQEDKPLAGEPQPRQQKAPPENKERNDGDNGRKRRND